MDSLKTTIFFIFILIITMLTGCNSNPVMQLTKGTVNGKVVTPTGLGVEGVSIEIDSTIITTGFDGTFSFNDVSIPYNVKLVQTVGSTSYGYFYNGISNFNPKLFVSGSNSVSSSGFVNFSFPPLNLDQQALIVLTDNNNIHNYIKVNPPLISGSIGMVWPGDSSIGIKLIILVYTLSGGNIVSYEKYGEKDSSLTPGETLVLNFDNNSLALDPTEESVSGIVNMPGGYSSPKVVFTMRFSNGSYILGSSPLGNTILSNTFSFIIPTGLPTNPKYLIRTDGDGLSGQSSFNYFEIQPGSSGNILDLPTAPTLGVPVNNATQVNLQTIFSFFSGEGTNVYYITVTGGGGVFTIITEQTNFSLPDFSEFGFNYNYAGDYTWNVKRLVNINSVNDLVSSPLYENQSYSGEGRSPARSFRFGN